MIQVYKKELNSFLNSTIAYLVISVFLTTIGLLMWVFPETNVMDYGYADMETLFSLGPYVLMFLIPAITMRSFAEEKKSGTMELLFTQPIGGGKIVMGKYLACFTLVIFSIAPSLVYYYSISQLGEPAGNLDSAGITGSYIGLILLGGVFTAIGLFSSSITENQIVAFIVAVFLCFLLYSGFGSIAAIDVWAESSQSIDQLGILYHYSAMSKGMVDSRNLIYFLSIGTSMLLLTNLILLSRKW